MGGNSSDSLLRVVSWKTGNVVDFIHMVSIRFFFFQTGRSVIREEDLAKQIPLTVAGHCRRSV
jgi:hypothetical protein